MPEITKILLVEDEEHDAFFFERALREIGFSGECQISAGVDEAIGFLSHHRAGSPPQLIILDLKMPGRDGLDLLRWLKADANLRVIPCLMLTSSQAVTDVSRAFCNGANAYFVKPPSLSELVPLLKLILEFWSRSVVPQLSAHGPCG